MMTFNFEYENTISEFLAVFCVQLVLSLHWS